MDGIMVYFLTTVACLLIFCMGYVARRSYHFNKKAEEEKVLLQQKLERARLAILGSSLRLVFNQNNGVTAVCSKMSLNYAISHYKSKANETRVFWDKIVLHVPTTFTFANTEQDLRLAHTGTQDDLNRILRQFILETTGLRDDELTQDLFKEFMGLIVERDNRLYVPYSGNGKSGEEDFKYYGMTQVQHLKGIVFRN